jgi:hypothetical protein
MEMAGLSKSLRPKLTAALHSSTIAAPASTASIVRFDTSKLGREDAERK